MSFPESNSGWKITAWTPPAMLILWSTFHLDMLPNASRYYEHKLIDIVAKNGGKKMIFWQEIFEMFQNNIHSTLPAGIHSSLAFIQPSGTVINVWIRERRAELMRSIVTAGYPALVSSGWYLDQQIPNINPSITHYLWLDTWQDFYNNDPMQGLSDLPIEQQKLVLGGEAWYLSSRDRD